MRSIPLIGPGLVAVRRTMRRATYPGSAAFWQRHYVKGGTSGTGSFGPVASFKAEIINDFVSQHEVASIIEFGCGDGNQLALAKYPSYIGFDVSPAAIRRCVDAFASDSTKSFFLYDPTCFVDNHPVFSAELGLSLDVIFHLTEDPIYDAYMSHLFSAASRYVIIYSSDPTSQPYQPDDACVRHRDFATWIADRVPHWTLIGKVENRYRYPDHPQGSFSDFFFYAKQAGGSPG